MLCFIFLIKHNIMETIKEETIGCVITDGCNKDDISNIGTPMSEKLKDIKTVDIEGKYIDILNTFMEYYQCKTGNKIHMFKDVNYSDPTSVNHIMAEFYDIICSYNTNSKNDPDKNKVHKEKYFQKITNIGDIEELYCLKCGKKKYYSYSLMSLIKMVTYNKPVNWIIYTLK